MNQTENLTVRCVCVPVHEPIRVDGTQAPYIINLFYIFASTIENNPVIYRAWEPITSSPLSIIWLRNVMIKKSTIDIVHIHK